MLDAASLEPQATVVLEAPAVSRPRPAGSLVLAELKSGTLLALDAAAKLAERWRFPLAGAWLAGDPLSEGAQIIAALTDGRVVWLDSTNGKFARSIDLGQQLSFGPQRWGENLVVGTLEGSLVVVDRSSAAAPEEEKMPDEN
jgi:hypothetical protein